MVTSGNLTNLNLQSNDGDPFTVQNSLIIIIYLLLNIYTDKFEIYETENKSNIASINLYEKCLFYENAILAFWRLLET